MAQIVAGWFATNEEAERAMAALGRSGFVASEFSSFYLAPPGQHGDLPLNDVVHHDEGAKESGDGALKGAALGGAVGLAAGTVAAVATAPLGPAAAVAGAGIGAYVGSLAGAMKKTHHGQLQQASTEEPVERPAGAMVAVCTDRLGCEAQAIATLRAQGARGIERAKGTWREGAWQDFDPRNPPQLIGGVGSLQSH
jgi:phage tail tape-measure protein